MVLDATLLNTQHYKVRIEPRVKWSNPGKGSLRVTPDNGRQIYLFIIITFCFLNVFLVTLLVDFFRSSY